MPSSSLSISATTNRITTSGFVYDADGDLIADGFNSLSYDEENRLTSASNGGGSAAYNYAGDGTRVQKVSGSAWTNYVYFGGKDIAEYDGGGAVQAEYVYDGDKLLAMPGNALNGGFEEGTSGWTLGTGASVITNATNAHSGSNYLQLSTSTGSNALGGYVAVSPGETIVFGGWVYCQSGSSTYTSWDLIAYNSSYGVVSYQLPSPSTVTSATWTYQIGTYTVPSGVAYVQLYAQIYLPTGATVARFDDGFLSAGTQYYHQDHLSNRLITNSAGADIGEQGHFPYGGLWYPSSPVTKWVFTGKERDSESGLDNFGARYMSSQYGRFMTPDSAADEILSVPIPFADLSNPQSLNLYSYVRNNPLSFTDPDGQNVNVCLNDENGNQQCHNYTDDQYKKLYNAQNGQQGINLPGGQFPRGSITCGGQTCGSATYNEAPLEDQTAGMVMGYEGGKLGGILLGKLVGAIGGMLGRGAGELAGETAGQGGAKVLLSGGSKQAAKDIVEGLADGAQKASAKRAIAAATRSEAVSISESADGTITVTRTRAGFDGSQTFTKTIDSAGRRCQDYCVNGLRFFLFESFFAPVQQPVAGAVGMWESRAFCEIPKELWKA